MKIDHVAAQYMKLQPNLDRAVKPDIKPDEPNVSRKGKSNDDKTTETKIEKSSIVSSNKKLNELLNSEERKTIANLFGNEGMAKLNQILDKNGGRVSELPRGILVNVKI